jgi:nucleoside 2-deoxyribosyltransferase
MLVYIAGPYTQYEDNGRVFTRDENVGAARRITKEAIAAGHAAICPHKNFEALEEELGWEASDWLEMDFEIIDRCDALLVVPGWRNSHGTQREIEYADEHGIPVYYYEEDGIPEKHLTEQRCPEQSRAFIRTVMQMYRVHLEKNADYSPANILGTGEIGLVTRLWDKAARIMELAGFRLDLADAADYVGSKEAKNEPFEDALMDISVYGIIGKLLREGKWGQ